MCLPATAIPAATLAVNAATAAASAGIGIYQAQQQNAIAQQQIMAQQQAANQQMMLAQQQDQLRFNQATDQARLARQGQIARHTGQIKAQEAAYRAYGQNLVNIDNAANRAYQTEQLKLKEARDAQAFKSQEIYAKAIGAKGKILAQGQTGQSIGAQVNDAERQAGFAQAKESATMKSKQTQAAFAFERTAEQQRSAMNAAASRLPAPIQAPQLAADPYGGNYTGALDIPTYEFG